jgi:ABC-type polysaccharide/polyol phosphate transport system ATPase subunit
MVIKFNGYFIDEATAVGDARFATPRMKIFGTRRQNTELIAASHSMPP